MDTKVIHRLNLIYTTGRITTMRHSKFTRKIIRSILAFCLAVTSIITMTPQANANAGYGIISTIAGSGSYSYSGDGGDAKLAKLSLPGSIAVDSSGNIYIGDTGNYRVRRIDASTNIITTVAGTGESSYSGDGGLATAAALGRIDGIAIDAAGNLYIADGKNYRVRKVDAVSKIITTVAGTGESGYSGDGGLATAAKLNYPSAIAVDSSGNIFLSDSNNYRIRRVDAVSKIITTVAGTGTSGSSGDGGLATAAKLSYFWHLAVDSKGNMYLVESGRIRKIDALSGIITTVAGNGSDGYSGDGGSAISAQIYGPRGVAIDSSGNIFIGDAYNHRIRKIDLDGIITTVAGNGIAGYSSDGVSANVSRLNYPYGVAVDSNGILYIADRNNSRIRKVSLAVSYNANSGSGTVPTPSEYNHGATVTVSGNTGGLVKKGYVFDGWNTKADGSGTNYAANDTFIMGTESIVLYARWITNPYSIEPISNQTLEPKRAGYSSNTQETKTITIKKSGTGDLEDLAVELSGSGSGDFEISQPAATTLNSAQDSTTFTVKAKDGLAVGTYAAVVTVSAKNADKVSFTVTQVVNTPLPPAKAPTANPASGRSVANGSIVTLTTETAGATIHYTTDGTMPSTSSPSGTSVTITGVGGASVTLKAIAVKDGIDNSPMMVTTYTISSAMKGDANGDGKVTAADALIIYKYIQNKITLTDDELQALDMNDDGKVDAQDAELIMKMR
ncbi:NHL domain-containing protein [Paenibacillus sp. y28]|uniref:NHL domain-containing protein n=1 Tax=Paenibacillus sp. y28 TaxID=3129110 RepID=UPI003019B064